MAKGGTKTDGKGQNSRQITKNESTSIKSQIIRRQLTSQESKEMKEQSLGVKNRLGESRLS